MESPLLNAAGSLGGVSVEMITHNVEVLSATKIGAINVGPITVHEQLGNEARYGAPAYYYDAQTDRAYDAQGLPNIGLEAARDLVPELAKRAHDAGKPLMVSVAPVAGAGEGDASQQVAQLVYEMLGTGADFIEIGLDEPDMITGERSAAVGYDLDKLDTLTNGLAMLSMGVETRLGVKVPPYTTTYDQLTAAGLARMLQSRKGCSFITTSGPLTGRVPFDQQGSPLLSVPLGMEVGVSGPAFRQQGREQLELWRDLTAGRIDLISALGVDGPAELQTRLQLGAVAAAGVTYLWRTANQGRAIREMVEGLPA